MAMKMRFDQRYSSCRDSFGYGQDNGLALTKVGLEHFRFSLIAQALHEFHVADG